MHLHRSLFFNLQPATLMKKRRRHTYFSVNFAKFFRNNFIMEKLLQISFERRILRKMEKRHCCYKEISQSGQRFQRTQIVREEVYLRNIDRKLIVIVIFNYFTNISFLKDFTNYFFISYCVQEKICNPSQNIWYNLKKYSKIGQGFKNVISNFACFLTAIVNV